MYSRFNFQYIIIIEDMEIGYCYDNMGAASLTCLLPPGGLCPNLLLALRHLASDHLLSYVPLADLRNCSLIYCSAVSVCLVTSCYVGSK